MGINKIDLSSLSDTDIYVKRKSGDTSFDTHWHDYYEIIYYENCHGLCFVNGKEYHITDKCIFFLTPTDFHRIITNNGSDAHSIIISFSENFISSKLKNNIGLSPRVLFSPSSYTIATMEKLLKIYRSKYEHKSSMLFYMLNYVLLDLIQNGQDISADILCVHPVIRNAMTYILTDISEQYSLNDIAHKCNITPSYFSDLFHKETGKTFKIWLRDIRINKARRLLEEGNPSVLEVSLVCGFESPSYFIRVFRESTGTTPYVYMKKRHNTEET